MTDYSLPNALPQGEDQIRQMQATTRAIYKHLGLLGELAVARVVDAFLNANPNVKSLRIELEEDGSDGPLWTEHVTLADEDDVDSAEVYTAEELDDSALATACETLHEDLQASTNPDSLEIFQGRYGVTDNFCQPDNLVWITVEGASATVKELEDQLAALTAPSLATPAAPKTRRRPGH